MTMYPESINVPFTQPRQSESQIEVRALLELRAESGGHQIHLRVPLLLFADPAHNTPAARGPALARIITSAETILRECFHETPIITHSPLPAISSRTVGARPIEVLPASLRAFRTTLRNALGISGSHADT